MYKIIIIDDEDEVREGIRFKTDWRSCGFELVGDFENGRDALDAMEALQPDVIITDICMPFMDGLELAASVMESFHDVKVVIITGYEDFEYARQAIKLKVNDFLVKPINSQEFTAFLHKIKQELDEERSRKEDLSRLRIQLNQSLPLLKERFLERVSTTRMNREEIARKLRYFQLELPGPAYLALVGDLDESALQAPAASANPEADAELLHFAAFNIAQEIIEKEQGGVVFRTRDEKLAAICFGPADGLELKAQSLSDHVRQSVEKYLKLTMTIGLGRKVHDLQQLPRSFQEALSALDYRFLLGKNRTVPIHDLEYGKGFDQVSYQAWEKKIIAAMKTGNGLQVSAVLKEWSEELKHSCYSIEKCHIYIHKLVIALMNHITETGFEETEVFGNRPFDPIVSLKTLDEILVWLESACQRTIAYLNRKRTTAAISQMSEAEAYILENYSDPQFSLGQVCRHIYMSISYFSALFKQHTGETFVEYLTRVRMEKAKELLRATQLKTYEIASKVGYADPHYFSVIFKRCTGMTPKEYRSQTKGNDSECE
jgi:two-component system response regulator YesN